MTGHAAAAPTSAMNWRRLIAGPPAALFDQRVGALQEGFWNREAYGLRGFEIDRQIEFRGLLDRDVFRLLALQNSLYEPCAMPKRSWSVRSK